MLMPGHSVEHFFAPKHLPLHALRKVRVGHTRAFNRPIVEEFLTVELRHVFSATFNKPGWTEEFVASLVVETIDEGMLHGVEIFMKDRLGLLLGGDAEESIKGKWVR